MFRTRVIAATAASLILLTGLYSSSHAVYALFMSASCSSEDSITVSWTFHNSFDDPTVNPPWVGYDVFRRSLNECGEFVRVNAEIIPWSPGPGHSRELTEALPAAGTLFQYKVVLVDTDREAACIGDPISTPCSVDNWVSCPEFSAPITHGTLIDYGWMLLVEPCADGCYPYIGFEGPLVDELRPFAGTEIALKFFATGAGCGFEGCFMRVDHYEIAECGPVQIQSATWGTLKARYR